MVLQQMINTGAQVVRIVKPFATANRDENQEIVSLLHEAEDRGCVAVGIDIDVFYGEKTDDENPYRYPFGPKTMDEMAKFVEVTNLPFIVKGVLSVSDALKCQEIGAKRHRGFPSRWRSNRLCCPNSPGRFPIFERQCLK